MMITTYVETVGSLIAAFVFVGLAVIVSSLYQRRTNQAVERHLATLGEQIDGQGRFLASLQGRMDAYDQMAKALTVQIRTSLEALADDPRVRTREQAIAEWEAMDGAYEKFQIDGEIEKFRAELDRIHGNHHEPGS